MLSTTIEGSLINQSTIEQALWYISEHNKTNDYEEFYSYFTRLQQTDKLNVLRLIFNGKTDLLYTYKTLKKEEILGSNVCRILDKVMIGKKTSGWVSEFINSVIGNLTGLGNNLTTKTFQKYLEDNANKQELMKQFNFYFPELFNLFKQINNICL